MSGSELFFNILDSVFIIAAVKIIFDVYVNMKVIKSELSYFKNAFEKLEKKVEDHLNAT